MKRRKPLRSSLEKALSWERRSRKPLKRTPMKRTPSAKGKAKRAEQMGDAGEFAGIGDYIRALPCVATWSEWWRIALRQWKLVVPDPYLISEQPDIAHLVTRGAGHGVVTHHPTKCGQPAGTPCVVPLRRLFHDQQEGRTLAFGAQIGVDLWAVARLIHESWKEYVPDAD